MQEFDCRVHFLCWKLRTRVVEASDLQARITEDMQLFQHDNELAKDKFKDTRQWYLKLLGMSIGQLRMIMAASDSDISVDDLMVEKIMRRVKPVPEAYLARLVAEGSITIDDMDCIIAGGYTDIEEYYDDLDANSAAVGSNWSDYDDDGVLIDEHCETDDDELGNNSELMLRRTTSHRSAADPLAQDSFDWAEDVEDELEMLETEEALEQQPSTPTSTPAQTNVTVTPVTPEDEDVSFDLTSSDVSYNSMTDPETGAQDSDNSSIDVPSPDPKPEEAEVSESEEEYEPKLDITEVEDASAINETEEPKADTANINNAWSAIDDTEEPGSPTYQVPLGTILRSDSDSDSTTGWDRDQIMDIYVKEYDMPYWQWEILYVLKLAAQKYKKEFEEARAAYKADPFNDVNWR